MVGDTTGSVSGRGSVVRRLKCLAGLWPSVRATAPAHWLRSAVAGGHEEPNGLLGALIAYRRSGLEDDGAGAGVVEEPAGTGPGWGAWSDRPRAASS